MATWTPCEGFDSSWRNSHHAPDFFGEDDMPVKQVLTFIPGQSPKVELMPAGTPGMEASWLRFRLDHYLRWDSIDKGVQLYTRDTPRGAENLVLPSGEIVSGPAILVAVTADGARRSLVDLDIEHWTSSLVPVPKENV